jgi:Raf kinase inhibitor-like YbhB/YbcL family protein
MKKIITSFFIFFVSLSCSYALTLKSEDVKPFTFLNSAQVCKGQNGRGLSPDLSWSNIPKNTHAFILFLHDPDAPHLSGFVHWVVYINNAKVNHLPQGVTASPAKGIYFGRNGLDENTYKGACPPVGSGVHRYQFILYALNKPLDNTNITKMNQNQILNEITDKIIDQAILTGFYKNKTS